MLLELILQAKSYNRLNEINRKLSGITPEQYEAQRKEERRRRRGLLLLAGAALLAFGAVCTVGVL